jgi:hypothetical protein
MGVPTPPQGYPMAPPATWVGTPGPPPPPKKSKKLLWIIIGVVVAVVIAVIAVLALIGAAATAVDVTAINYTSADNACGTAGGTSGGFTTSTGGSIQDTLTITNGNIFSSCIIATVSATTPGFSISGANVPLTIPASGTLSLSFTITAPSSSYTGVLTIDLE